MDIIQDLVERGFDRVELLDGKACGIPERRLILCFVRYEADEPADTREIRDAVIHAYYPVSQHAYRMALEFTRECAEKGVQIRMANEIHIKRILHRLPFLRRGRNTLSYMREGGSRFHVQILTAEEELSVTADVAAEEYPIACGSCRKCIVACPGGAITEEGFERERCLRFWMMNGKMPPEEIAERMGNRLLGCDDCEACCPMNGEEEKKSEEESETGETVRTRKRPESIPLKDLLSGKVTDSLVDRIGRNYAIPNRVLTQGCLIAGSLKREDLAEQLDLLCRNSASPVVRQAAEWALSRLR